MKTPPIRLLHHAMQAYSLRLQGLASNIAHLDTPGAQRQTVRFEESLQQARRSAAPGSAPDGVTAQRAVEERAPQLEDELMELADTQMRAQLAARALHSQFGLLRTGVTGRTV